MPSAPPPANAPAWGPSCFSATPSEPWTPTRPSSPYPPCDPPRTRPPPFKAAAPSASKCDRVHPARFPFHSSRPPSAKARQDAAPPEATPDLLNNHRATSGGAASSRAPTDGKQEASVCPVKAHTPPPAFPSTLRPQGGTANSSLVTRLNIETASRPWKSGRETDVCLVGDRGRPARGLPEIGKQVKTPMFSVISHPATRLEAASPRAASEIVRPHKEGEKETPIGPIFYRTNRSSPVWKRLRYFSSRPSFSLPPPLPSPRHTTFPFSGAGQGTGC